MCERGYLSVSQVGRILELQRKRLMGCPGCRTQYNVADFEPGKQFGCPRCGMMLAVIEDPQSVGVDGTLGVPPGYAQAVPSTPPMMGGGNWGGVGPVSSAPPPQTFEGASTQPPPPPGNFQWAAPTGAQGGARGPGAPGAYAAASGGVAVPSSSPWVPPMSRGNTRDDVGGTAGAPPPPPPPQGRGFEASVARPPLDEDATELAVTQHPEDGETLSAFDDTMTGVTVTCPICSAEFLGQLDNRGQVACVKCRSMFTPSL